MAAPMNSAAALVPTDAFGAATQARPMPAAGVAPVRWTFGFDLPGIGASELWLALIDSSTFNRALPHPRMSYREEGGVLHGRCRYSGILHEWTEPPWDWVAERHALCVRHFSKGLCREMRVHFDVQPLLQQVDGKAGSRLTISIVFVPRNRLFAVAYKLARWDWYIRYRRAVRALERDLRAGKLPALRKPMRRGLTPGAKRRLGGARQKLLMAGCSAPSVETLVSLCIEGDEVDLERMRVYGLARRFGIDERDLLHTFLYATRAGLLQLSWDLLCPHCRGPRVSVGGLEEIPEEAACEPCGIRFGASRRENAIEVTFRVHPSVRKVERRVYCAAETAEKKHIRLQLMVAAGETLTVNSGLGPGKYRLRVAGEKTTHPLWVNEGGATDNASVQWSLSAAPSVQATQPSPRFELHNDGAQNARFIVEEADFRDDALLPGELFAMQEFRDLFSEAHLSSRLQLDVGTMTVVFTDVVGSTALYRRLGDAAAFAAVKQHFELVGTLVAAHNGAVVKTIGDAAMAVFPNRADAAAMAVALAHASLEDQGAVDCRVTLNSGPCLAVNLNSGIDYFGMTVNVAAKLQSLAGAGEVVVSEAMWGDRAIRDVLDAAAATREAIDDTGLEDAPTAMRCRFGPRG